MTRPLVGTIMPEDYAEIREAVQAVLSAVEWFYKHKVNITIGDKHRLWEYGSAIQALLSIYGERMPQLEVMDVGSGVGALGPALALTYNMQVTECEPSMLWRLERMACNKALHEAGHREIEVMDAKLHSLPRKQYDAVFCISVLEHVAEESTAWAHLASRVKPNGLLFVTTDCVENAHVPHQFDNLRRHNFTTADMAQRIGKLQALGFTTMGRPDYEWHGAQVHDYTFFRAGMVRMGSAAS